MLVIWYKGRHKQPYRQGLGGSVTGRGREGIEMRMGRKGRQVTVYRTVENRVEEKIGTRGERSVVKLYRPYGRIGRESGIVTESK